MEPRDVIRPLIRAGVKPRLIWGACRTGRLVAQEIRHLLTSEDIAEWEAALKEYDTKYPNDDWDMRNFQDIIVADKF